MLTRKARVETDFDLRLASFVFYQILTMELSKVGVCVT